MKKDFLFNNLIKTLQDRIPQRGKLANELAELLDIEKEAVYRRLRGSVPFSFHEVRAIANHLGFSLDSIAENASPLTQQMTVLTIDLLGSDESNNKRLDDFIQSFQWLQDDKNSEVGSIGSIIPPSICSNHENIFRFHLFKWSHQFGNPQIIKPFAETRAPEWLNIFNIGLRQGIQNAPKTVYIFDRRFIEYFIFDVLFFYDIRLILKEDVIQLKEALHLLISDLERYATNGCFDTGNKVEFFLANVQIDANYNYIDAAAFKFAMMRTFAFSDSYSYDKIVFRNMKNWLNFLKRTSTFISECNATERIIFFEQQRKLVEAM